MSNSWDERTQIYCTTDVSALHKQRHTTTIWLACRDRVRLHELAVGVEQQTHALESASNNAAHKSIMRVIGSYKGNITRKLGELEAREDRVDDLLGQPRRAREGTKDSRKERIIATKVEWKFIALLTPCLDKLFHHQAFLLVACFVKCCLASCDVFM
jgi:hypothetical protein